MLPVLAHLSFKEPFMVHRAGRSGIPLLAGRSSWREYTLVDRTGFPNEASAFQFGFCNKSYNFAHMRSKASRFGGCVSSGSEHSQSRAVPEPR